MTRWLAYDIGTTGTKAALVESGEVLESVTKTYETQFGDGGVAEQNALDWWEAMVAATQELDAANTADAMVITGQMQNIILLDETLETVRPVILYNDTRAHAEIARVRERVGANNLRRATGNNQDAGSLLGKLLWLIEQEAESIANAKHLVFGAADYIIAKLTGVVMTDTTNASTTGLLDINRRIALASMIFQSAGLQPAIKLLPKIMAGGTKAGELSAKMAGALGLSAGIPVYLAPGDAGSATIGAGSGDIGTAYAYIGTSGWVAFTADRPADPDKGVITLVHPQVDRFIQVAPMMTATGNIDWMAELFQHEAIAEVIEQGLAQKPSNLIYLPYLNGERSPFSDPFARGVMIGMSPQTTQADMYRAALEGVVFAYKHILDALAPPDLTHLMLTGGGSRTVGWCQLFADVLGIPVKVASDAENVGIRGAIRSAEVASGAVDSYAIDDVPVTHTLIPQNDYTVSYSQKYALFRQSYEVLKPVLASAGKLLW